MDSTVKMQADEYAEMVSAHFDALAALFGRLNQLADSFHEDSDEFKYVCAAVGRLGCELDDVVDTLEVG